MRLPQGSKKARGMVSSLGFSEGPREEAASVTHPGTSPEGSLSHHTGHAGRT